MNLIHKIQNWGDGHHPKAVDLFRVFLGLILIWKGVAFWLNLEAFGDLMKNTNLGFAASISIFAHLIILLHIIGGLLIALGTHTRLFCLLNLPIVLSAVIFTNSNEDIWKPYAEFWLSVFVLLALVCFLVWGNGKLSVEKFS